MATLSAAGRKRIPTSSFAIPSKAKTAKAKAKSGNYPINTRSRAGSALSRVAQHGSSAEKKQVRAAVKKKYPTMGRK